MSLLNPNIGLLTYFTKFGTENKCIDHFVEQRKQQGITCSKCGCQTKHYYISTIRQFRCATCNKKQGLRANTYMADSNLPLHYWYFATYIMTNFVKSVSAKEMQRQLGHKFYEPIWLMMQKIRATMRNRDQLYTLNYEIEGDEGFVTTYLTSSEKKELPKPIVKINKNQQGRGSDRKTPILVLAESQYTSNANKHKPNKAVDNIRLTSLAATDATTLNYEIQNLVDPHNSSLTTDSWNGYKKTSEVVSTHTMVNTNKYNKDEIISEHLPWVHKIISNFKRNILNAHHAISHKYLDNYLAEFQYKFNRRRFRENKFEHLIIAGLNMSWKQAA